MSGTALDGVKVLDLSLGVAGPYCTRLLAGLGADVVKVEPPGGDPARKAGPFLTDEPGPEDSALFQHLNVGKRSVTLDLWSEVDRSVVRWLASRSHIVVESFPPGLMAELGLGFDRLRQDTPALVMTSISDFGQSGPYRDYRASEIVHLALGGLLYTTGDPNREPLMLPGYQASYLAGLNAAVATLAALYRAERTGVGSHVDVSVMESVASALEATTVVYARDGVIRRRQGNRHGRSHPTAVLPCKDGYVGVMVASEADWELFAVMAGLAELAAPRFASADRRAARVEEIEDILRPWLMTHSRCQLFRWAQQLRLPFGVVLSPQELLRDPQHRRRRFITTIPHPVLHRTTLVGPPFRMGATPWTAGRAPFLGEHHEEVLSTLEWSGSGGRDELAVTPTEDVRRLAGDEPGDILAGIRVVDLTTMWAGPLCTRLLAELGAEVIKIEYHRRPDGTRANPGYFNWLNRNKLSLGLDLSVPRGRELFCELVRVSDILVENFSPRVMGNFGLDYPTLRRIKPDLIMLSMPAYGSTGPYRDYVAYGPGIETTSGLSWLTGYEDGSPMLSGSAYGDPIAGLHGTVAILAALRYRRLTGLGQWIDLAQREALSQVLGEVFVLAGAGRQVPARVGNRHRVMCPHGVYRCCGDDLWLAIAVGDDEEWERLCRAMGMESLGADPRFKTALDRKAHEAELDAIVASWTRQRDRLEAMRTLQAAGVMAGAVLDGRELSRDEHLAERGFFVCVPDTDGQIAQYPGLPWKTLGVPPVASRPAPRLGQHNEVVLRSVLHLTEREIGQLEKDGVIGRELRDSHQL